MGSTVADRSTTKEVDCCICLAFLGTKACEEDSTEKECLQLPNDTVLSLIVQSYAF